MAKRYNHIVIGIDQSYSSTGIGIAADGKLLNVTSTNFKGLRSRSDKRKYLANVLHGLLKKTSRRALKTTILCERIRTFSNFGAKGKRGGPPQGLNPNYLKMTGALIAVIVDVAAEYGVEVYSVDTRAWKSQVVGNSKAKKAKGKRDAKSETVRFIEDLGFDLFLREKTVGKNKGEKVYDDDAADAGCIALYGFIPKSKQRLMLEQ